MKHLSMIFVFLALVGCTTNRELPSQPGLIEKERTETVPEVKQPQKPIDLSDQGVPKPSPRILHEAVAVPIKRLQPDPTEAFCKEVGSKLGSVSISDCLKQDLLHSSSTSLSRPLVYKDYPPHSTRSPLGKVLLIGGIHGDEFSSVSIVFKWMDILNQHHAGLFHWRFVPLANPDGLLKQDSQRQNHNGVDLNRNFPTTDWDRWAQSHWVQSTHRNPRRNPGPAGASELETRWLVKQINEFRPDVVISVHAPQHLIDYDGPPTAPRQLGTLNLRPLGVYPGSMGNYAGTDLQIPVVTVELQSAGIMPTSDEIKRMWLDLVRWLRQQLAHDDREGIQTAVMAK